MASRITKMAVYGNVGQFQEEIESFTDYADRFDAFLLANQIDDARKSSMLLATIGPEPYISYLRICAIQLILVPKLMSS